MAIGCTLMLLPLRLIGSWATSAQLVDPGGTDRPPLACRPAHSYDDHGSPHDHLLHEAAGFITSSGRSRRRGWLVRKLRQGGDLTRSARDEVWTFVTGLRLPYYFRLGLLGFVGTMAWLLVPVTLIALGASVSAGRVPRRPPPGDRCPGRSRFSR